MGAAIGDPAMSVPPAGALVELWERGAGRSATERGLLLMELALPDLPAPERSRLSIGHRDSCLIGLRAQLFGSGVEAVTACGRCGESIAIAFDVDEVRAPHAAPGTLVEVGLAGRTLRFRLPNSEDLLAIEPGADPGQAERDLLRRCLAEAADEDIRLADAASERISGALAEADPQAELILDVACPECGEASKPMFDIVLHLWSEVEDWVLGLLQEIDRLAGRYGWSERDILAMSHARRQAYLDLMETAPA